MSISKQFDRRPLIRDRKARGVARDYVAALLLDDAEHADAFDNQELTEAEIEQAHAMVIRETPSAIVFNKPAGLATQGGSKMTKHRSLTFPTHTSIGIRSMRFSSLSITTSP